jgi:hypothetical protein
MWKIYGFKGAVMAAATAALLCGGMGQAVNNRPPPPRDSEKLQAALVKIEKEKAAARMAASEAMDGDLTQLEKEWGIKVLGIRTTAAGYALDFRYKVLDPHKAAPLLQRQYGANPYVLVERSGAKLGVPFTDKAGSLRSSVTSVGQIRQGRNYGALFANPGRHVKAGDRITVVFGDFKVEHLVAQ